MLAAVTGKPANEASAAALAGASRERRALAAGVLLVAAGVAVLVGWVFDLGWLKSLAPGWPTMKANAALALLLIGLSLLALRSAMPKPGARRAGEVLATGVGLVGGLSLAEHLLQIDLGIDQLLLSQIEAGVAYPGRMSAATALGFTLLATSLFSLHAAKATVAWAARLAALLVGLLGLLVVVSYAYGVKGLYGVSAFSTMAMNTAALVCVAAAGVLSVAPERGPLSFLVGAGVGHRMARRMLPVAIVLPLVVGWLRLLGQQRGLYGFEFGLALFAMSNVLSFSGLIWWTALGLERADAKRRRVEAELAAAAVEIAGLNAGLEQRVAARTAELEGANHALQTAALQLERQKKALVLSVRDLEQFAYVASHDLQEPLRAVAGCAQILQRRYQGKLDRGADELIEHLVEGATRMRTLTLDLLAFSQIGVTTVQPGQIDSASELAAALRQLDPAIARASATLTSDPLPTVMAIPGQLAHVFENLIDNALKYRGAQPPAVHVTARRSGAAWEFAVTDNGIGVEQQYFDRIFLLFQRLHTRRDYPGTGIGLALCKKIVELHGGRIWLESVPKTGSTFRFTIPSGE